MAPPELNLAAQRFIGVHFSISRVQLSCTGLDRGAFWDLQSSIWLHRARSGCTFAFQDFKLGAPGPIVVHSGTSRARLGLTGIKFGEQEQSKSKVRPKQEQSQRKARATQQQCNSKPSPKQEPSKTKARAKQEQNNTRANKEQSKRHRSETRYSSPSEN